MIAEIRDRFGALDVLFLNAGIVRGMPIGAYDEATVDDLLAVNFKGQFCTLQKAPPLLNNGASIIFTVGIGVTRGVGAGSAAAASRGALLALVPSPALELAPRRIRVNAVSPGAIATPSWAKLGTSVEAVNSAMAAQVPLVRLGASDEIAEVVAFLASPERRYQRTATTITSGGNRNPANADFEAGHGRRRADSFTGQACLDHANPQCNGALEGTIEGRSSGSGTAGRPAVNTGGQSPAGAADNDDRRRWRCGHDSLPKRSTRLENLDDLSKQPCPLPATSSRGASPPTPQR